MVATFGPAANSRNIKRLHQENLHYYIVGLFLCTRATRLESRALERLREG